MDCYLTLGNSDFIIQKSCIDDKFVTSSLEINTPPVLHGGSGNKDSEVVESIRYGVGKINISSDMKRAFFVALEHELKLGGHEPDSLFVKPMQAASEVVAAKMALFRSVEKAALYR